jgi:uncharacterized surface protein with fasciclin (FAS1) repeats
VKTDSAVLRTSLLTTWWSGEPQNVDGVHKTLQGADLTVTGFGNNLRVNKASVVCGGVQTANATVYLIDTVLTSPAM